MVGACDSDSSTGTGGGGGAGAGAAGGGAGATGTAGYGGELFDGGESDASLYEITPVDPVITVVTGEPLPTVQFQLLHQGNPEAAIWMVSRGEIGAIDDNGLFTPCGAVGGQTLVQATVGTTSLSTTLTVNLQTVQNGSDGTEPPPSSGGWGGVGGEGVGPAVDGTLAGILTGSTTQDAQLAWLYPYDGTIWPTGVLPPLLQWAAGAGAVADGVLIHLWSDYYDYQGTFARPTSLANGAPFVRHPIPPAAWRAATLSSAGGPLHVELVVAAGGTAYGPITESWTVARGQLRGTVYYQSYGTNLAKNYQGAIGGDGWFGGATLTIQPGADAPALVAGTDGGTAQCRVCHSVALGGGRMVVQHGNDYSMSSSYDLQNGYVESAYDVSTDGNLGWVGMLPDGSKGLGNRYPLPGTANPNSPTSLLYDMTTGAALTTTGLNDFVTRAGFPAFAMDATKVAFNFYTGPGDGTIGAGDGTKLVAMDFDAATNAFANPRLLYQGANQPGWPSFLPTNDAVVFQVALPGATEGGFATRYGGKGELWWSDLATGTAVALERANGKLNGTLYLPTNANNHGDDSVLNYEPTICPIPSGGYAWVVFMSRRMYGNVATIDPWWSDPREHDLVALTTTRKLWVAAIDLNAPAGTDPSHPAFYLPGQELLAGNARGYWVNAPCKPDGDPCDSGDECCGGFCQPDPDTHELVCGQQGSECSAEYENCDSSAECCDPTLECINHMCVQPTPH